MNINGVEHWAKSALVREVYHSRGEVDYLKARVGELEAGLRALIDGTKGQDHGHPALVTWSAIAAAVAVLKAAP